MSPDWEFIPQVSVKYLNHIQASGTYRIHPSIVLLSIPWRHVSYRL